jgi:hypothetical protein
MQHAKRAIRKQSTLSVVGGALLLLLSCKRDQMTAPRPADNAPPKPAALAVQSAPAQKTTSAKASAPAAETKTAVDAGAERATMAAEKPAAKPRDCRRPPRLLTPENHWVLSRYGHMADRWMAYEESHYDSDAGMVDFNNPANDGKNIMRAIESNYFSGLPRNLVVVPKLAWDSKVEASFERRKDAQKRVGKLVRAGTLSDHCAGARRDEETLYASLLLADDLALQVLVERGPEIESANMSQYGADPNDIKRGMGEEDMTYHPISKIEVRTIRLPSEAVVDSKKVVLEAPEMGHGTSQAAHLSVSAFLLKNLGVALFATPDMGPIGKTLALVTPRGEIRSFRGLYCLDAKYSISVSEDPIRFELEALDDKENLSKTAHRPRCPWKITIDGSLNLVDK